MKDIRIKHFRFLLYPLSLLYGIVVSLRNFLFDIKIIKSKDYNFPVIVIGNLTIGGTGKTPMTEYLIRLLQRESKVAVLSRGYGRNTKGFLLGSDQSTVSELGDEPCQMLHKFPHLTVAVDADRRNAIARLRKIDPSIDVFLLDDAFQHRYVKPGLSILLMDYKRPIYEDCLLPAGDLRESMLHVRRADMVIVTKCPLDILPIEKRIIIERLALRPYQKLFFSTLVYRDLLPLRPYDELSKLTLQQLKKSSYSVLIVTGIAKHELFIEELNRYTHIARVLVYDDHHHFKNKDLKYIEKCFQDISNPHKCIVMTEKDATRLKDRKVLPSNIQSQIYYLPIEVDFLDNTSKDFNKTILDYVGKNKRDGFIH